LELITLGGIKKLACIVRGIVSPKTFLPAQAGCYFLPAPLACLRRQAELAGGYKM